MQIHEFVDEGLGHSSDVVDLGNRTGASLLATRSFHDPAVLDDGPDTWPAATCRPLAV